MRRFDGEYRCFLFRGMPLRDATGAIIKWCGTNADIDERKRAEIDLRRVLDSIPGLVATNTPTGETELVNRQMARYFGRTREELERWRTLHAVHPDDLPFVVRTIEAWMRSPGATGPFEFDLPCGAPTECAAGFTCARSRNADLMGASCGGTTC
jgi:PAS domain-containing protein